MIGEWQLLPAPHIFFKMAVLL